MNPVRILKALPVAGLCVAMALAGFDAAAQSPFTNAVVYTWSDNDNDLDDYSIVANDATFAQFASSTQGAWARAEYGVNKAFAAALSAGPNGMDGQSTWSDGFVVTGGNGSLDLSVRLTGTTTGTDQGFFYGLYVSSFPFAVSNTLSGDPIYNALNEDPNLFGVRPLLFEIHDDVDGTIPPGPFDQTFAFSVPYASGETFYVTSVLDAGAWETASADFGSSANFGISAPLGATLETLSGTTYAAAVPEPETWALMLAGLGLLGFSARLRGRSRG